MWLRGSSGRDARWLGRWTGDATANRRRVWRSVRQPTATSYKARPLQSFHSELRPFHRRIYYLKWVGYYSGRAWSPGVVLLLLLLLGLMAVDIASNSHASPSSSCDVGPEPAVETYHGASHIVPARQVLNLAESAPMTTTPHLRQGPRIKIASTTQTPFHRCSTMVNAQSLSS